MSLFLKKYNGNVLHCFVVAIYIIINTRNVNMCRI